MALSRPVGLPAAISTAASGTSASRTQWNITKDLYVGLDVIYHKVNTATFNAAGTAALTAGPLPAKQASASYYHTGDIDAFVATWRIHRDIVP